ncbi:hypothetical protein RHSIM_Rhsim10G0201900 [Rhododendron simsii]|uniref:Uncharacterized protein n=1 Tax=Rhododendron simsii TaxID=118357 RepID=A0A834LD82_RHOSS|nr:hypothetical protein RHSIM_Rhsim10G0201900 [Rhododendron simsii]
MTILALISLSLLSILGALAVSPTPSSGVSSLISKAVFEQMLKHRNDAACQGKGFTHTRRSSMLPIRFMVLELLGMIPLRRERLLRFWLKLPMKLLAGGQRHQTEHMHGDTVLLLKKTHPWVIVLIIINNTLVPLGRGTMAVVPSKFHNDLFLQVRVDCHSIVVITDALDSFYHY